MPKNELDKVREGVSRAIYNYDEEHDLFSMTNVGTNARLMLWSQTVEQDGSITLTVGRYADRKPNDEPKRYRVTIEEIE